MNAPREGARAATRRMAVIAGLTYGPWLLLPIFPGAGPLEIAAGISGGAALLLLAAGRQRRVPLLGPHLLSAALWLSVVASLVYFLAPFFIQATAGDTPPLDDPDGQALLGWALFARFLPALTLLLSSALVSGLLVAALARDL